MHSTFAALQLPVNGRDVQIFFFYLFSSFGIAVNLTGFNGQQFGVQLL